MPRPRTPSRTTRTARALLALRVHDRGRRCAGTRCADGVCSRGARRRRCRRAASGVRVRSCPRRRWRCQAQQRSEHPVFGRREPLDGTAAFGADASSHASPAISALNTSCSVGVERLPVAVRHRPRGRRPRAAAARGARCGRSAPPRPCSPCAPRRPPPPRRCRAERRRWRPCRSRRRRCGRSPPRVRSGPVRSVEALASQMRRCAVAHGWSYPTMDRGGCAGDGVRGEHAGHDAASTQPASSPHAVQSPAMVMLSTGRVERRDAVSIVPAATACSGRSPAKLACTWASPISGRLGSGSWPLVECRRPQRRRILRVEQRPRRSCAPPCRPCAVRLRPHRSGRPQK